MVIDWTAVGTVSGALGGFALIGKWLMRGVEKSNETLPVIVQSLTTMNEGIKITNEGVKELFIRMGHVETKQEVRDKLCDERNTDGSHRHNRASDTNTTVALKESVDMLRRALHGMLGKGDTL